MCVCNRTEVILHQYVWIPWDLYIFILAHKLLHVFIQFAQLHINLNGI